MKRQINTIQMKEKNRSTEVQIDEEEIGILPEKEFRIMIVKMIKSLENKMEKMQDSINQDLEELKKKHTETNNTITIIKNTLYYAKSLQSCPTLCNLMDCSMPGFRVEFFLPFGFCPPKVGPVVYVSFV